VTAAEFVGGRDRPPKQTKTVTIMTMAATKLAMLKVSAGLGHWT
jgi:hypothetical protein